MPSRSRSRSLALLALVLTLVASLWAQDPKPVTGVTVAAPLAACTTTTADASRTAVANAIAAATPGDRICVPAGTASWSSGITISENIQLIGAGIGQTVITSATGSAGWALTWTLQNTSTLARLSGFTFSGGGGNNCILSVSGSTNTVPAAKLDRIRIDHNRFTNSTCSSANAGNGFSDGNVNINNAWGVMDHNTADAVTSVFRAINSGTGATQWTNWGPLTYGTDQTMWVEDNAFSTNGTYMVGDCDVSGRYSVRYNALSGSTPSPWFDWHGYTSASSQSCFGGEFYGNTYTANGRNIAQRGGKSLFFLNGTFTGYLYNNDGCPGGGSPQTINDSYSWGNRSTNTTGSLTSIEIGPNVCGTIVENSAYWQHNTGWTPGSGLTTGVAQGTLANRPTTCTTGVAYWATDQSTTTLAGMVGIEPSTPIAGTLYKCTSTNTWTSYYTPYTYPHPLRGQ